MLAFLEGMASGLGGEVVTYTSSNTVTITSPNRLDSQGHKFSVSAPLGAPLRVSASPQWEEMGGAAGLGKVLSAVESVSNAMAGVSLTQPSMYRRYYKGTDPLSFEAVLNFYATSEDTAKSEVFDKLVTLIGFCYPRQSPEPISDNLYAYIPPGPNLWGQEIVDAETGERTFKGGALQEASYKAPEEGANLVQSAVGLAVSGANALTGLARGLVSQFTAKAGLSDGEVDYITFQFGKLLHLSVCYLDSVSVEFSQTLTPDGWPHAGKATCKVRTYEGSYWVDKVGFDLGNRPASNFTVGGIIDGFAGVFT